MAEQKVWNQWVSQIICFGIKSFTALGDDQCLICANQVQLERFFKIWNNQIFCLFAYLSIEDCLRLMWELDVFYGEVLSEGNPFNTNKLSDGHSVKHIG